MSEEKANEYKAFIKNAWAQAVNYRKGMGEISQDDFVILPASGGYVHAINAQRIKHIHDRHSNDKLEKQQGQIVITEKDFLAIPEIIQTPHFEIRNIKYERTQNTLYGRHTQDGHTYIYIELMSTKKRRYLSKTLFKINKTISVKDVVKRLKNNAIYDLSNIEVVNPAGRGGYPPRGSGSNATSAVATSANPADTSVSLRSGNKSIGR